MVTPGNKMDIGSITTSTYKFNDLKHKWNLWAHLPQDTDWTVNSYEKIHQYSTVEDTIAISETLPEVLVKNCMLFVMRNGISPMWEDPKNRNGGCFSYKVTNKCVCDVWRNLIFVLVGNTISANIQFVNSVTGITISPKKNFCIIKIWMTNCDHQNPSIVTNEILNLDSKGCLFKKHTPEF
jgi:hypothetical protein